MRVETQTTGSEPKKPLKYILILILLSAVFHYKIIFSGANSILFGLDFINQHYGFKELIAAQYRAGSFPLWNPYFFAGMPLLAVPWSGALYPPDVIFLLVPLFAALKISVALHTMLMSIGMFFWVREFKVSDEGSFLAAAAYAFCAHFFWQAGSGHISENIAAAWLPFVFLCYMRFINGRGPRWLILGGGALALALLGGNHQYIYYGLTALGVWIIVSGLAQRPGEIRTWTLRFAGFGVLMALALGLSAAQILPAAELFRESSRSAPTRELAAVLSYNPRYYLGFLFPLYYILFEENIAYFGLVPLGFALAGIFQRRRLRDSIPLAAAGLMIVIMMMGAFSPFFGLLFRFFPLYKIFRIHSSAVPVLVMMLCPLAAMGFDGFFGPGLEPGGQNAARDPGKFRLAVLIVFSLLFLTTAFFWGLGWIQAYQKEWVKSFSLALYGFEYGHDWRVFAPPAVIIICLGLILLTLKAPGRKRRKLFLALAVIDLFIICPWSIRMGNARDYGRLMGSMGEMIQRDPSPRDHYRVWLPTELMNPDQAIHLRVSDVNGYCSLNILRFRKYVFTALDTADDPRYTHPYPVEMFQNQKEDFPMRMLNVKYRASLDPETGEAVGIVDNEFMPRAFWIGNWRVAAGEDEALKAVTGPDFDPSVEVALESPPPFDPPGINPAFKAAEMIEYKPRSMEFKIDAPGNGILVISEVYYPGWKAFVDGEEAPVQRVNYLLRGLALRKGGRRVRLEYRPESFYLGGLISLGTLALCALGLLLGLKKTGCGKNS